MKKLLFIFAMLLMSTTSRAWYCLEVASERLGDTINACGIGEAIEEDSARKLALSNAYKELDLICSHSADCADKALDITPMRTDCKKLENNFYRCHRGVSAAITGKPRDLTQKQLLEEVFVPKKIIQQDGSNYFQKTSIVDFNSTPQGAHVHVDGVEICQTPCTKEIDQGEHKVTFEKEDFDLYSEVKQIMNGRQAMNPSLQMRYGYLTIQGLPADAIIKVNNKEIATKDNIRLNPNEHIITVTSKYFQPWFKQFKISKGEMLAFKYDAEALLGHMKISATDDKGIPIEASIMINGQRMSQKTPTAIPMQAGRSVITLSHPDFKDNTFDVQLEVDQKLEIKKSMTPNNFKDWEWYFGLGGGSESVNGISKNENYSCCILFDFGIQKTLSSHFSLKFIYNYIGKMDKSNYVITSMNGTPNTTAYYAADYDGNLIAVALPFFFNREAPSSWFIIPEIGKISSKFKYDRFDFSSSGGYGSKVDEGHEYKFSQSFKGLGLGIQWMHSNPQNPANSSGWYLLGGFRKFEEPKNIQAAFDTTKTNTPKAQTSSGYIILGFVLGY